MVMYAPRPSTLDGCWAEWRESDVSNVVRSTMDNGSPKVRARFTGILRNAEASVTLSQDLYDDFMSWYRADCIGGVLPTNMLEPDGVESIWRFTAPPSVDWLEPGSKAVKFTVRLEQLPGWGSSSNTTTTPPVCTVIPRINGAPSDSTFVLSSMGTWIGYPVPTLTAQWVLNGVPIEGATSATLVNNPAYIGKAVSCSVIATNVYGVVTAYSNAIAAEWSPAALFYTQDPAGD